jgi:hypothetical protein
MKEQRGGEMERLADLILKNTVPFRKGEPVVERDHGNVHVTEVFGYPHQDEAPEMQKVDVHFITVGVPKSTPELKDALVEAIEKEYPSIDRLKCGPSFIEVGGELGDQELALRLFGLGEVLGLWKVITPKLLQMEGPEADMMAGQGFVMISGYKGNGKAH